MTSLQRIARGIAMCVPFSRIKTCLYRSSGAQIGRNVHMAPGAAILCDELRRVVIGNECSIGMNVRIRCAAFAAGERTKIACGACIDGASEVTMGRQVYVGHHALLDCWDRLVIEDRVQVSPGAFILTHDSSRHYISGEAVRSGPTVLRENSYVGAGAIVLPGVEVGRCAIIGAGAVVTRNVPDNGMAVGNPATVRMQHSGRRSA